MIVELDEPEPFAEAGWVGADLALGDDGPVLRVVSPTERCAITTFDPDTLERDNRVLAGLARERENLFGVYARVARPGWAARRRRRHPPRGTRGLDLRASATTLLKPPRGGAVW